MKAVHAWLDCPNNKINDPYPGSCSLYLDTNQDQICDHSQPAPRSPADWRGEVGTAPRSLSPQLWLIPLILIIYLLSRYASRPSPAGPKSPWLKPAHHRLLWNTLLLISFAFTGLTGLIIFFGYRSPTLRLFHNYAGIIAVLAGFLHLFERLHHFKPLVKRS